MSWFIISFMDVAYFEQHVDHQARAALSGADLPV